MTWLDIARKLIGTKEKIGGKSNPLIISWMKALGPKILGISYTDTSIPWCGGFMAHVMVQSGLKPPAISIRAKSWAAWGQPSKAVLGAVAVFERAGGGHVGLITGITRDGRFYRILGGNQSDSVCETLIASDRCIAVRWAPDIVNPMAPLPIVSSSAKVSTNEA